MSAKVTYRQFSEYDAKRKAVKLVVTHIKKKISRDFLGQEEMQRWIENVEKLLNKEEFDIKEFILARKELNSIIDGIIDEEIRFKLRDSWYSMGKALDKKPANKQLP